MHYELWIELRRSGYRRRVSRKCGDANVETQNIASLHNDNPQSVNVCLFLMKHRRKQVNKSMSLYWFNSQQPKK